jgi:hypothetical protein
MRGTPVTGDQIACCPKTTVVEANIDIAKVENALYPARMFMFSPNESCPEWFELYIGMLEGAA